MRGLVNRYALNGASAPSWVLRASAIALAAGATVDIVPTVTTYGAADIQAAAATIAAPAWQEHAGTSENNLPNAVGYALGGIARAADATATAKGSLYASVQRDVYASATAEASASGYAIPDSLLGEAEASMSAGNVLALAHIVHPGRATSYGTAESQEVGGLLVLRYATAQASGVMLNTTAEASFRWNGDDFDTHDAWSNLSSRSYSEIEQVLTSLVVTTTDPAIGTAVASAVPFVNHPGSAMNHGTGLDHYALVVGNFRHLGDAEAFTLAMGVDATAVPERFATNIPARLVNITMSFAQPRARIAATAGALAESSAQAVAGSVKRNGGAINYAGATFVGSFYGVQHFADAEPMQVGLDPVYVMVSVLYDATSGSEALAVAELVEAGEQHWSDARAVAQMDAAMVDGVRTRMAHVDDTAGSQCYVIGPVLQQHAGNVDEVLTVLVAKRVKPGTQHYAESRSVTETTAQAQGRQIFQATTLAYSGRSHALRAYGLANTEIPAPPGRSMYVQESLRGMVVAFEDRTMRILS